MKKYVLIMFIGLLMVIPLSVKAETNGKCGDNCYCNYDSNTQTLRVYGSGEMYGYVRFDESIGDYRFYDAERPWYSISSSLKHVIIEEGITRIGEGAFCQLDSLETVSLPNSLLEIGKDAFRFSQKLSSINIPQNIIKIEEGAFECCKSITEIDIPTGITVIEPSVFNGCSSLRSITFWNKTN